MMTNGYKETKVGKIPEEWDVVRLINVLDEFQNGYAFSAKSYSQTGIPIISMACIGLDGSFQFSHKKTKYWNESMKNELSKYLLEKGDLLIAMTDVTPKKNLIGRMTIIDIDEEFFLNQRVGLLKTNNKINKVYLKYLSNSRFWRNYSISVSSLGVQANLSTKDIKRGKIPLPPLPEQQNIAEILSTVDEAIEKTAAIIEETRQLKKGLMQKLFTEGIGHTRFKETKIGSIPEAWEINRLNNFGEFLRGKSINKSEITESGFPCVRYGDIYVQYEFANTVTHFSAFIGKETADNGQRIKYGDIIFAGTGETQEDIGKCVAYVRDEKAYAGGDLFLFRPSNGISVNSEFLSYCLNSGEVGRLKSRLGQGLSIFHIYPSHVQTLEVPLPTIEEQNQIVKILNEVDAKIEKEEAVKAELEQLKKGLMQVLLTGKVRVKA